MKKLTISGVFPAEYLLIGKEKGIDINSVLLESNLIGNIEKIRQSDIPFPVMLKMMEALWEQSQQNVTIGMQAGLRISITSFGNYGQAILSSSSLDHALTFMYEYWEIIGRGISIDQCIHNQEIILSFNVAQITPTFLKQWMIESAVFSFWRALISVFPDKQNEIFIQLSFQEHDLSLADKNLNCSFNKAINSIHFPAELLNKSFPFHSPASFSIAKEHCDRQLSFLNSQLSITSRILVKLGIKANGYPNLDEMSVLLNMASRTLRRKLREENTKYSEILQQKKLMDAKYLLKNSQLNIEKIAEQLGYQDEANFCRAFKKWTKLTPSQFRNKEYI